MQLNVSLPEATKANIIELLPDCSGSMSNPVKEDDPYSESRSDALKRGIAACIDSCRSMPSLKNSLLVGLTTISDPIREVPFTQVQSFQIPSLEPNGGTPFGKAINCALEALEGLLHELNNAGRAWNVPQLVIVSDGAPAGEPQQYVDEAIARVRNLETDGHVFLHLMGVTGSDCARLDSLGFQARAIDLSQIDWTEAFRTVSQSAGQLAAGQRPLPTAGGARR